MYVQIKLPALTNATLMLRFKGLTEDISEL